MFLVLDGNKVIVTEEGMMIKAVKELYDEDKSPDKETFYDIMKGLYFIYRPDSIFQNISLSQREEKVSETVLKKPWSHYMKDPRVKKLAELYVSMITSPSVKNLERIKEDIEKLHEHLAQIPMEYTTTIDQDVEVDVKGEKKLVRVKKKVKISNIEQKEKVYASFLKIQQTYEKMREIVEHEMMIKKTTNTGKRMFDKPNKVPHNV